MSDVVMLTSFSMHRLSRPYPLHCKCLAALAAPSDAWRGVQATAAALSSELALAEVKARQACYRPLSRDGEFYLTTPPCWATGLSSILHAAVGE